MHLESGTWTAAGGPSAWLASFALGAGLDPYHMETV